MSRRLVCGSVSPALRKARRVPPSGDDFWTSGFWTPGFWNALFWVA